MLIEHALSERLRFCRMLEKAKFWRGLEQAIWSFMRPELAKRQMVSMIAKIGRWRQTRYHVCMGGSATSGWYLIVECNCRHACDNSDAIEAALLLSVEERLRIVRVGKATTDLLRKARLRVVEVERRGRND